MNHDAEKCIQEILLKEQEKILTDWMAELDSAAIRRRDLIADDELRREAAELLSLTAQAAAKGNLSDFSTAEWQPLRDFLSDLSRSRAAAGFTPGEVARFVLSLKSPLFLQLLKKADAELSAKAFALICGLVDQMAMVTFDTYAAGREKIIRQQQMEMLELSTPVIRLWEGVLALPLIGTLDSNRTQVVMENLLQMIVETGSQIAILDITGVPAVDTLVAQHLLKTVAAARLMGAQCIISGIRPQIAQTMVHLGVAFGDVITKATLADALAYALRQIGIRFVRNDDKAQ
ncbi:MAG: STAS domain-containing protein [candidate division KSB1 bacterium]|nr:STAS domain-containing protein [candidate division KSB1 bacterium]